MSLLNEYGYKLYLEKIGSIGIDRTNVGRIIAQHKGVYDIVNEDGEMQAKVLGSYHYSLKEKGGYPVVGDYVYLTQETGNFAVIREILPRTSMFYRKDNWGKEGIQVLAANFDIILICTSLNKDFNISRLMRYMIMAKESGAEIGIVLTKSDLCTEEEIEEKINFCRENFQDISIIAVSTLTFKGIDELKQYFQNTKTVMLLGSSGVGKSSLVNSIGGEKIMEVGEIGENDKGHHTTVHRQIIKLAQGILIDTPGIREIGLVDAQEGFNSVYEQINQLAKMCKYSDCTHTHECGCAVQAAIKDGKIEKVKFDEYLKLQNESNYESSKEQYMFEKWQKSKEKSKNLREIRKNRKKGR